MSGNTELHLTKIGENVSLKAHGDLMIMSIMVTKLMIQDTEMGAVFVSACQMFFKEEGIDIDLVVLLGKKKKE